MISQCFHCNLLLRKKSLSPAHMLEGSGEEITQKYEYQVGESSGTTEENVIINYKWHCVTVRKMPWSGIEANKWRTYG